MAATPARPLSASMGFISQRLSVASRIRRLTALSSTTRTGMSWRCVICASLAARLRRRRLLQIERHGEVERAALAGLALQPDASAQQRDEVRRNRETQAGASILARRRAVSLDERLEDRLLLLLRHADAGIRHAEPQDGVDRSVCVSASTVSTTSPCSVNLMAFPMRLVTIWRRRLGSPISAVGTSGRMS